jgi:enamine deaminase RidA (YjgF/YER057c/UK114 family)
VNSEIQRHSGGTSFEDLAGYSRAVRVGDRVVVSGTAAHGIDGGALSDLDTYAQTRQALETALGAATELGASVTTILLTRLLLAPGADWRAAATAHGELFGDHRPANTTWYVGGLIPEGALVEVELEACLRSDS